MATLVLTDFQCIDETNEIGSDSPYFVFFIGKANEPLTARLVTVRRPGWDEEIDQGEMVHPNVAVDNVDEDTLILCALMEEDFNTDVTTGTGAFRKIREQMRSLLAQAAAGSVSVTQIAEALIPQFRKEIEARRTNDDLIDIIHVPANIDLATHGAFTMEGDGGRYLVWFAIE